MMEDEGAIFLVQVLIKPQSKRGAPQKISELCLARGERIAPHVGPVEFDQIEGPHEHVLVAVPSPDQLETRDPVIAAGYGLAVNILPTGRKT
jgi:hypothetical protein